MTKEQWSEVMGTNLNGVFNTLVYEMKRRGSKKGLATLCIGGGMGVAMCVEAMN